MKLGDQNRLIFLFSLIIVFIDEGTGILQNSQTGKKISQNLPRLMYSLFECMTEGCSEGVIQPMVEETGDTRIFVFYWSYTMFFVFAVMNPVLLT